MKFRHRRGRVGQLVSDGRSEDGAVAKGLETTARLFRASYMGLGFSPQQRRSRGMDADRPCLVHKWLRAMISTPEEQ